MLNLVLFGPPGAGKGTQSEKLIKKYNLVHLSTGDMLRAERKAGTPLGKEADEYIKQGNLVPDDVVIRMIEEKLDQNRNANGFIFDGFPRTTAQAAALDKLLEKKGTGITMMLALDVPENVLKERLILRGADSGRADDKDPAVIQNRIEVYNKETAPVADYYSKQGKLHLVQGVGEIGEIFASLCKKIDAAKV